MEFSTDFNGVHELVPMAASQISPPPSALASVITARLYGYDSDDVPVVTGLPGLGGQLVRARSTVPLTHQDRGSEAVVLLEGGDAQSPIIIGLLRSNPLQEGSPASPNTVSVRADDERIVLDATREIVLRCGGASITLTRAGKVTIQGTYILSRSSGYNKIKGAAVDIN